MDRASSGKATLKRGKKKLGKVEIDRQKQAERKRRRLEKALATSAAIRSELEKKKQKKMEEQQRLDKEGLAIAEAVALHVLIGEDNEEETHDFMPNQKRRLYPWDNSGHVGLFMGHPNFSWSTNEYGKHGCNWNEASTNDVHVKGMHPQFYKEMCGLMAAEAVASLQIGEKPHKVQFSSSQVNFYREY